MVGPAPQAVEQAAEAGWRAVLVPPASTTADFYAALARALDLPAWFGVNLDALWDCLMDLPGPTALVLDDWQAYARAEPEHWRRVAELLEERAGQQPPFAVLLAGPV